MNNWHLTQALAEQHRADLLHTAEQHRRVRAVHATRVARSTAGRPARASIAVNAGRILGSLFRARPASPCVEGAGN